MRTASPQYQNRTKISQRKFQSNVTDEYIWKNPQKHMQFKSNNTLKGSHTMMKWNLSEGCKDSSVFTNQSM